MHALLRQRNELSSHVLLGAGARKEVGSCVNQWVNIPLSTANPMLYNCFTIVRLNQRNYTYDNTEVVARIKRKNE